MARKWMWLLAGVFAAALVAFAWWPEVAQPEGCPEDGCRVGYRFEDGGKAPEGWEPFETDDPVVALMDACLTYFITGDLRAAATAVVVEYQTDQHVHLKVEDTGDRLTIVNFPRHDFGTFQCSIMEQISSTSQSEVSRWIFDRFESDANWELQKHWRNNPVFRSDYLGAEILAGADDDGVVLKLQADYFGPAVMYDELPEINL